MLWLNACIKSYTKNGKYSYFFKGAIEQYLNIVKQLTGQTMNDNMKNEIVDEVIKDNNSLNAFFEITSNIYEVKYAIFKNVMLKALKSIGFNNATEKINNDAEEATLELKNGYKLGVWFAGYLDYLIIGIIPPKKKISEGAYVENLLNAIESSETKFCGKKEVWPDKSIVYRPCEYTRLDVSEPWLKIQNGDFKKFIEDIVKAVKSVE